MKALIDFDMPAHEIGHIQTQIGENPADGTPIMAPLAWDTMVTLAKGLIIKILIGSAARASSLMLTSGPRTCGMVLDRRFNRLSTIQVLEWKRWCLGWKP